MREAGSPQQIAEACGARLYELDHAARAMGATLDSIEPGRACMSLTVRNDMVNSHGICHGGFIFSLADSAFAYSSNSRNRKTVAAGATIDYVSAARLGDRLAATAEERALPGRTGIYDVRVANQQGDLIAYFRGRSYRVAGEIVPELTPRRQRKDVLGQGK